MIIRKITKKDQSKVKELIQSIMTEEYPSEKQAYADDDLRDILATYGGAQDVFFVSELDGDIIGTVGIKADTAQCALMRRLFLGKKFRGKGYGLKLVEEAISFCRESGYKSIAFRTTDRMEGAISLCKKMRFSEAEKIDLGGFRIYKYVYQIG